LGKKKSETMAIFLRPVVGSVAVLALKKPETELELDARDEGPADPGNDSIVGVQKGVIVEVQTLAWYPSSFQPLFIIAFAVLG
jgi:hypothetical protein